MPIVLLKILPDAPCLDFRTWEATNLNKQKMNPFVFCDEDS